MSIQGIGLDIVELHRVERLLHKSDRFEKRVLTPFELDQVSQYKGHRKIEFVGGRFAAKEAFAKAAGTGISGTFGFQDIEIRPDLSGKPTMVVAGSEWTIHLSITHSKEYAAAQVILEN